MMNYDIVICMTGAIRSPLVGSGDTTAFSMYLDGGGNLFISSQDWADYFSRLGVSYPKYYLWFKRTFRLELADDDAGIDTVIGSMGGPFEGLSLTLGGGDGADNVTDPDLIIPLTGADICMWFPDNDTACAGVCFDSCFVYFSFPWEAIDNQADRDTLMARVLNYLRNFGGITDIAKPESPLILSAVPNPFNASTELGFELSSPGDVSLDIFDISGRKVANLANGTFEDGVHELAWDGRDNTNRELPSGIYMARLVAGEKIVTKKLLLAK